jgi:hypothetical protein
VQFLIGNPELFTAHGPRQWEAVARAHDDMEAANGSFFESLVKGAIGDEHAGLYLDFYRGATSLDEKAVRSLDQIFLIGGERTRDQMSAVDATILAVWIGSYFDVACAEIDNIEDADDSFKLTWANKIDELCDYVLANASLHDAIFAIQRIVSRTGVAAWGKLEPTGAISRAKFISERRLVASGGDTYLVIAKATLDAIEPPGGVMDDTSDGFGDDDAILRSVRTQMIEVPDEDRIIRGDYDIQGFTNLPEPLARSLTHSLAFALDESRAMLLEAMATGGALDGFPNSPEGQQHKWEIENVVRFVKGHMGPMAFLEFHNAMQRLWPETPMSDIYGSGRTGVP